MLIEELMAYPVDMELYYVLGQTELAGALLSYSGVSVPDITDYQAIMPTHTIPAITAI